MKSINNIQLGERLRRLREKTEYTQQQIADALHIDRSTYTYYETGKTTPDIFTLLALVNIFHITLDSLFQTDGRALDPPSGQSSIYSLSKPEKQLLACYRAMPPEKQKKLLQVLTKRRKKR